MLADQKLALKGNGKASFERTLPRKLLPADGGTMKRKPSKTGFTKLLCADTT